MSGVSFGVCASPGDASLVDNPCLGQNDCILNGIIVQGADLAATNNGSGPVFFNAHTVTVPSDGWTVGSVINLLGADSLPAQENAELVIAHYDLLGGWLRQCQFLGCPRVVEVPANGEVGAE